MKQNLNLLVLTLLGAVALCVAQDGSSTPATEAVSGTTLSVSTAQPEATSTSGNTIQPEATSPSGNTAQPGGTSPSGNTAQPEGTSPSGNTIQPEATTPSGNTTDSTQKPPVEPTEAAADPGLSDGAIAGIVIGSIGGVAAVGGGVFGILKKTGRI